MRPSRSSKANGAAESLLSGRFQWSSSPPLLRPARRRGDPCHAVKDPTVVRFRGRWHMFHSIRSKIRTHQIEYLSFADWPEAAKARRHVLTISDAFFCAPQVSTSRPKGSGI